MCTTLRRQRRHKAWPLGRHARGAHIDTCSGSAAGCTHTHGATLLSVWCKQRAGQGRPISGRKGCSVSAEEPQTTANSAVLKRGTYPCAICRQVLVVSFAFYFSCTWTGFRQHIHIGPTKGNRPLDERKNIRVCPAALTRPPPLNYVPAAAVPFRKTKRS